MKRISFIVSIIILTGFAMPTDFITEQKKNEKVQKAYKDKGTLVLATLKKANIKMEALNILIMAYKDDNVFEVYAKNKTEAKYKLLATYSICTSSGILGPKRKEGDGQVPEGFYHINMFNPLSNYYLSLGINYPNAADKKNSDPTHPGGSIFIHGDCVTIGCLPMTNDKIKEIYIYAIQAHQAGQANIPVYIFPFKMTESNMQKFKNYNKTNPSLLKFWETLKNGYDKFEKDKEELIIRVDTRGNYLL